MRSLDKFNRYIEEQETRPAKTAKGTSAPPTPPVPPAPGTRYVMRGGVTIAVPDGDAASGDAPASATPPIPPDKAAPAMPVKNGAAPTSAKANGVAPAQPPAAPAADTTNSDAALWQRLPHHIQFLMSLGDEGVTEAAQKYYTRDFKETRRDLIARLLDPTLTLEDTARVLGVVPATVRRYTNRGILPHHRTVGQQRRFQLSDVLAFLEAQQNGRVPGGSDAGDE